MTQMKKFGLSFTEKREGDELFKLILDNALDAYIAIDENSNILEWSLPAEKIFGWSKQEVLGQSLTSTIIPPKYKAAHDAGMKRFLTTGKHRLLNQRIEITACRKDGDELPVELSITPIKIAGSYIFSASLRDITQRKQIEEALRNQTSLLQSILDNIADGVSVADTQERLLLINPAAERMLGLDPLESHPNQVVHDYELYLADKVTPYPHDKRPMTRVIHGEAVYDLEAYVRHEKAPEGRWVSANAKPLKDSEGRILGGVVVLRDITERKQVEEELRQAQEHFRLLVEGITDYAIIMMDVNNIVVSWNPGAERILGYSKAEVIGQPATVFFTPEDNHSDQIQRELQQAMTEGRFEDERWHVRKDNTRFWGSGIMMPLWDKAGSLRGFVKIMRDNTARKIAEEQIAYLANHDPLTGLANRVQFNNRLHDALAHAKRDNSYIAVLLLDLDRFKFINDTLGHHIGDLLLKEVSLRLLSCVRETDLVARLGGDEFVIIQTHLAQPKAAGVLTQKLIKELSRTYLLDGQEIHSSASIGVAVYPKDAKDPVQLLKNADIAMYQAKAQGRYNYVFYKEEMRAQANSRKSLEENLRRALEKKEFILHYQPQIDLSSWKVTGVEALLRWQCPQLQMLPPAEFINLAEETGLIIPIGEWVLRTACLQNKIWQKAGISPFRIGVNLSARQFKNAKFVETVGRALKDASLDPAYLELEITERLLMESTHSNSAILSSLKTIGVHISIDDFGTGFSALSYLKHFPIDVLKIDQAITQHLPHNRYDTAITSAIISLAQALGIRVIAESVETVEQLAFLKKQGCTSIQGFLCSPPVTAGELEKLLREGYWSRVNPS